MKKNIYYICAIGFIAFSACQSNSTANGQKIDSESDQNTTNVELPDISNFNTHVAYVPSIGEGTISAVDLDNNTIKWTLKVSEGNKERKPESAMGIAATKDGRWVFTGDAVNHEAVIVDAENQKIVKRLPLKHGIHAIDICPHDHWVWVAGDLEEYPWLSATTVIDVEKQEIAATLSPALGRAAHLAFTPDGKEVWVASVSTNTLWVWDANERSILDVIPLVTTNLDASSPEAGYGLIGVNEVTISPDGKMAYAVGPEAGIVFAVDVKTRKVVKTKSIGERTHGIGVSRDGKEVWTANNTGTVSILDANSLSELASIDLSKYADEMPFAHIAFSLDGNKAYVSIAKDLAVIDVAKRAVITTIPFGYGTHEISLEDFYVTSNNNMQQRTNNVSQNNESNKQTMNLKRESDAAGISIAVTPKDNGDYMEFYLSLNTHSGDIMKYDLTKLTTVKLSDGSSINEGFEWEPESESSHHRKGTLKLNKSGIDVKVVELVLHDIGVKKRTFSW